MDKATLSYGQLDARKVHWPDWVSYIVVQCTGELMGFEYEPTLRLPAGPCPAHWDRRNGMGSYTVLDKSLIWDTECFQSICLHVGKSARAEAEKKRKAFLNSLVGKVFTNPHGDNAVCTHIQPDGDLMVAGHGRYTPKQLVDDGWLVESIPLDESFITGMALPPDQEKIK